MYKFIMGECQGVSVMGIALNDNVVSHQQLARLFFQSITIHHAGFVSFGEKEGSEPYGRSIGLGISSEHIDKEEFESFINSAVLYKNPVTISNGIKRDVFILLSRDTLIDNIASAERIHENDVHTFLNRYYGDNFQY